jgi:polyhydroxybutyrate depolymerase
MAWAEGNGCSTETEEVFQNGDSTCNAWTDCDADVEMCIVDEGGHTWPGSATGPVFEAVGQGKTTLDLDATDRMWDFFDAHPIP